MESRGCQVGIEPPLQFGEAQKKSGECPSSAQVNSSCYLLPSTYSAATWNLESAQHRLLEGQSMFNHCLSFLSLEICLVWLRTWARTPSQKGEYLVSSEVLLIFSSYAVHS